MDQQPVTVCERHKRKQKSTQQIATSSYICMNRYCPNAYAILCDQCKLEHRDHQVKILSVQDVAFLIDRLLKMPFKQVGTFISESVEMLKKVKLVNQFAKKIAKILQQLQQQTLDFIAMTQTIVSQYAQCKGAAVQISQSLAEVENRDNFEQFRKRYVGKLNKIDYNVQKDRLEYGSLQIKQKEDLRRKNLSFLRRRMEEVKQYSMKIIEVILNNEESDEEDDDIAQKKKLYQVLKGEVTNLHRDGEKKNAQLKQKQYLNKRKLKAEGLALTKQTVNWQQLPQPSPAPLPKQSKQCATNTDSSLLDELQKHKQLSQQYEKGIKLFQSQLEAANLYQKKIQSDYKSKIYSLQKQRQSLVKEKDVMKRSKDQAQKLLQQKCELFNHYEHRLRDNYQKRTVRYREREQIIRQLAELVEHQRVDAKSSRESAQKENRANSKTKRV